MFLPVSACLSTCGMDNSKDKDYFFENECRNRPQPKEQVSECHNIFILGVMIKCQRMATQ